MLGSEGVWSAAQRSLILRTCRRRHSQLDGWCSARLADSDMWTRDANCRGGACHYSNTHGIATVLTSFQTQYDRMGSRNGTHIGMQGLDPGQEGQAERGADARLHRQHTFHPRPHGHVHSVALRRQWLHHNLCIAELALHIYRSIYFRCLFC